MSPHSIPGQGAIDRIPQASWLAKKKKIKKDKIFEQRRDTDDVALKASTHINSYWENAN